MVNIIIVLLLVLICIYSVNSYRKKLKNGCCGSDNNTSIKVKDKNINHYPYQKSIKIEGMSCQHCKMRIEDAFHEKEGFFMKINLKQNCGTLYMKKDMSDDEIKEIIQRVGYQVSNIK